MEMTFSTQARINPQSRELLQHVKRAFRGNPGSHEKAQLAGLKILHSQFVPQTVVVWLFAMNNGFRGFWRGAKLWHTGS